MAKLELTLPPTHYAGAQSASWVAEADVVDISYSINGPQPTVSKYIAYDTLSPPNPFIAVTQDGRGNVVYDGGFPKFYNTHAPASTVTTFSGLTASFKYLYNALNFVANPNKVAAGNKRVLLLGDASGTESYGVKSTDTNGFRTSFERLCAVAGYTLTIKDRSDWGGVLSPTLVELDQYCLVIVMGTMGGETPGMVPDTTVTDFVSYREAGNGLILITDHGPVLNSIEEASLEHGGFFSTVNRLAVNFGAYFTGDFARTPVNVGFLRSTYGDHPLYNGMLDSEDIMAGGSESQVVVADLTTYTPGTVPNVSMPGPARYVVSALAVLADGSTQTYRYAYTVDGGEFSAFRDVYGNALPDVHRTFKRMADLDIDITDDTVGSVSGNVVKNGVVVGTFTYDSTNGTQYTWSAGGSGYYPIANGDVVTMEITTPFLYRREIQIEQFTPLTPSTVNLPESLRALQDGDMAPVSLAQVIPETLAHIQRFYPSVTLPDQRSYPQDMALIRKYLNQTLTA